MAVFQLNVNGTEHKVDTIAERPLLDVLREDLDLTGAKYGCGEGQCRACTVLMDGRPIVSCITPVKAAAGKKLTTIEGLQTADGLHKVQQAFLDEGAFQCGYCTPGMILRTVALLEKNPSPSETQVIEALDGNLCRCGGYTRILAAVERAARGKSGK
ncbi:MAG TPA: (2Fe-2S)-binding protein [Bryobacteraceae bacterium]|nr:(2Fe-2S)-binding protein [Bryobacteraceae bacterium]